MDTGNGVFVPVVSDEKLVVLQAEHPRHGGKFFIGQNVKMDESKFLVIGITKKTITLKLLPR